MEKEIWLRKSFNRIEICYLSYPFTSFSAMLPNDPFAPPSNLYAIDQFSVREKLTCRHLLYFWCFTGRWNMHICTSNSHFVVKTARNKILQNKKEEVKNFKFDLYFPSTKFRGIISEINNEYLIRYSHRSFWYLPHKW